MTEWRAGTPVVVSGLAIVPIEATARDSHIARQSFWVYGAKKPVAIVLLRRFERKALDISGAEVDAGQLEEKVPGLREVLDALGG
jgi:hypothetical protein